MTPLRLIKAANSSKVMLSASFLTFLSVTQYQGRLMASIYQRLADSKGKFCLEGKFLFEKSSLIMRVTLAMGKESLKQIGMWMFNLLCNARLTRRTNDSYRWDTEKKLGRRTPVK